MQKKLTLRPSPTALLNPRSDPTFKTLFTRNTPDSNDALRDLISAMLGENVRSIRLLPNEPPQKARTDKQMAFDVHCVLENGEPVEIEMQGRDKEHSYASRAEAHVARLLAHATRKGKEWKNVPRVYQLSILNFYYDKGDKSAVSWYTMRKRSKGRDETEQGLTLNARLNVVYLELPKIRKLKGKRAEDLTKLERWGMFLAYADKPEVSDYLRTVLAQEESIMKANEILEEISVEEANWYLQNSYDDWERDQLSWKGYQRDEEQRIQNLREDVERQQQELAQSQHEFSQQQQEFSQQRQEFSQQRQEFAQSQQEFAHKQKKLVRNALALGMSVAQTAKFFSISVEEVQEAQNSDD